MAHGICVDCNYDGPLARGGDCPRCGSTWTTSQQEQRHDEDQWDGLYDSPGAVDTGMDLSSTEIDAYTL